MMDLQTKSLHWQQLPRPHTFRNGPFKKDSLERVCTLSIRSSHYPITSAHITDLIVNSPLTQPISNPSNAVPYCACNNNRTNGNSQMKYKVLLYLSIISKQPTAYFLYHQILSSQQYILPRTGSLTTHQSLIIKNASGHPSNTVTCTCMSPLARMLAN